MILLDICENSTSFSCFFDRDILLKVLNASLDPFNEFQ
jgi:hypothetical protein